MYAAMYEDLGMNDTCTVNGKYEFEFQSPKYVDTCQVIMPNKQ